MPVLGEETSIFPEDLLDTSSGGTSCHGWWVLYTRSRQEKVVARHLLSCEVGFYLPLIKKTLTYGRRRVTSRVPLFAGYLFVCGAEEARVSALTSNQVSRVLPVIDGERLCSDLQRIRRLIAMNAPLTIESRLTRGHWVRIRRGPFEGLEGMVLKRLGQTRLVVSVDFIQQGASIEVEDHWLELIGPRPGADRRSGLGRAAAAITGGRKGLIRV